ncbi:MAG: B12-binding domain-containing radical SAM protein, partial [Promethearchaeota archaeon]
MTQRKLKIILINPYVPPDRFGTISPWDVPSLGLGYIAAVLEQNHKDVSIIDAFIERITPEKLNEILEKKKPDVIGLTANAYSAKYAAYMAYKIKQRFDTLLVMGGPYPTSSYQYLLKHNLADIIVIGEGEYTFLELINQLERGEEEGDISDIKGISYKVIEKLQKWIKNPEKRAKINEQYPNNIIINPRRPYIQDLDALPFPAWHLFPNPKKYKNLRGVIKRPYLPIFTTRGCDHACLWCNKNIHGYKIRARSVENVIDEIEYFQKKYGIKEFAFMDDNFTFDEKRIYK